MRRACTVVTFQGAGAITGSLSQLEGAGQLHDSPLVSPSTGLWNNLSVGTFEIFFPLVNFKN